MSLDQVVAVNITTASKTPTQKGFGTPLIMAYHTLDPVRRVRTYTSLTDMVSDGFGLLSGAYLSAVAIKSQSPSPATWKIGRRAAPYAQQVRLTVQSAAAGSTTAVTVRSPDGVGNVDTISVVTGATGTTATTAAALAAALSGGAAAGPTGPTGPSGATGATGPYGVVANVCGSTGAAASQVLVTTTGTSAHYAPGLLADLRGWTANLALEDVTLDSGIAADIAACAAEDSDFYGICLDSNSDAEIAAATAAVESMIAILAVNSSSTGSTVAAGSGLSDPYGALKTLSYARTVPIYNGSRLLSWAGAAALGGRLPDTPGSSTWCHKSYAGVPYDTEATCSGSAQAQLKARNANVYVYLAGSGDFQWGTTPSGEYVDQVIFLDWMRARLQERILAKLQNLPKVPFTDTGINIIVAEIQGQLADGVKAGGINPGGVPGIRAPWVEAPKAGDVSSLNRAGRFLPDVTFGFTLSGAIHALSINGTVSV